MYEFWYDYIQLKCHENAKLCYKDTDSFIIYIKTEDFYGNIGYDLEKGLDTWKYEVNRPLPKGTNKKVIVLMKNELGGKIMIKLIVLISKTYSYLMDDKTAKGIKKCVLKKKNPNLKITKTVLKQINLIT